MTIIYSSKGALGCGLAMTKEEKESELELRNFVNYIYSLHFDLDNLIDSFKKLASLNVKYDDILEIYEGVDCALDKLQYLVDKLEKIE